MTQLIIVRHGNTFDDGEVVRRVGGKTDIPLVEAGRVQATRIGQYFKQQNIKINRVYSSPLKRTKETAECILKAYGENITIKELNEFTEVDYGVDENKPESEVVIRLGQKALDNWEKKSIVPNGWNINPPAIIETWIDFARTVSDSGQNTLVVSSTGIIRFAPYILEEIEFFFRKYQLKVSTGAVCFLEFRHGRWSCTGWNIRP